MALVNSRARSGHVQVIRCDIKRESVEKFRDVQNEPISGKSQGYPLGPPNQTLLH
jgi:hypothetical protein